MQDASQVQKAERCLRTAIEVAREQSAKSWELRSTMSLARLLEKQGCRDEARTMHGSVCGFRRSALRSIGNHGQLVGKVAEFLQAVRGHQEISLPQEISQRSGRDPFRGNDHARL
jgi:hypothetical protein